MTPHSSQTQNLDEELSIMATASTAASTRRARMSGTKTPHPKTIPPASHPKAAAPVEDTADDSNPYTGLEVWENTTESTIWIKSWDGAIDDWRALKFTGSADKQNRSHSLLAADVAYNIEDLHRYVEDKDNVWLNGTLVRIDVDDEEQMTDARLIELVNGKNARQTELLLAGIDSEVVIRRILALVENGDAGTVKTLEIVKNEVQSRFKRNAAQKSMTEAVRNGEKPPKFVR